MAQFWREGKFCDIAVCVEGETFQAHRVVLAAGSEMLAALSDGERFADSNSATIDLKDMSAAAFKVVLTYLYEGDVDCATSLLTEVGAAASFLQVTPLVEQTCEALKAGLSAASCVSVWGFAKLHSMDGLVTACREKAIAEFRSLDGVDYLPREEMCDLLASDDLNVDGEEFVYEMALRYARAQEDLRASDSDLARFLSNVRFPLLSKTTFQSVVMSEPLLRGAECQNMLARAFAAVVYGQPAIARGVPKTAADAKAQGLSAVQAKALDLPGVQIFALCRPILDLGFTGRETQEAQVSRGGRLVEGREIVLNDGKFGKIFSRDRDDAGPWHVVLDGTDRATGRYHTGHTCYKNYRFLEWITE
jgi:hypothetical protein